MPDTTISAPLQLEHETLELTSPTAGTVFGDYNPSPAHTSVNVDPNYLVFDPTTATLTIPIASVTLTAGTAPPDVTLANVHGTLSLEDAQSNGPIDFRMQGTPGIWALHRGTGASYDATTPLALSLTLSDPPTLREFVDLLTTGGDNTTRLAFHADSKDLPSGATLQLTFGRDVVVFSY